MPDFSPEDFHQITEVMSVLNFKNGDTLIQRGETATFFGILFRRKELFGLKLFNSYVSVGIILDGSVEVKISNDIRLPPMVTLMLY